MTRRRKLAAKASRAKVESARVEPQPNPSAVALRFATGYGGQPSLACQPSCPPTRRRKLAAKASHAKVESARVEPQPNPSAVALRFATGYGGQPSLACQP
jgi:hypothetical protein